MKWKKVLSGMLLLSLVSSSLCAQPHPQPISSVERIREIIQELQEISTERERYLTELEYINEENKSDLYEREKELQQRITELNEKEKELNDVKMQLELFGSLIEERQAYLNSLQKKLVFWRTSSIVLSVSTVTLLVIVLVKK